MCLQLFLIVLFQSLSSLCVSAALRETYHIKNLIPVYLLPYSGIPFIPCNTLPSFLALYAELLMMSLSKDGGPEFYFFVSRKGAKAQRLWVVFTIVFDSSFSVLFLSLRLCGFA